MTAPVPEEQPQVREVRLSPEGHDPLTLERVPITGRLRRLLWLLLLCSLGVFVLNGALTQVLLPLHLEALDEATRSATWRSS